MNQDKLQQQRDANNTCLQKNNGFLKRNQTQITIIFIGLLPSLILIVSTFISLGYMQQESISIIQQFADQMYKDQINNSKLQNYAVLFQINQQVQKIAWQMNILNEFLGKQLLDQVINNKNYIPAIHNVDRTYLNQENSTVLKMFQKNPILTSVWHQVAKGYLEQLDQKEQYQLKQSTFLDSIWKAIKYDNQHEVGRWMQIQTIYLGLTNDGLIYMTSNNTTYATYVPSKDCPYQGPYKLDLRCRYYYYPTISNISTQVFAPSLNFGSNGSYFASNFCQRRVDLSSQQQNDIFSILCITLNLQVIPLYFQNFGKNSKFQMLIDPQSFSIVYNSQSQNLSSQSVTTVMQAETNYLQDQSQANIFLGNLTQNSNFIILNTSTYQFNYQLDTSQKTFEYKRNGTDCFVLLNVISMVDKVPKIETLRSVKPADKFQLKNVFLFIDVLSKEKLQIYSKDLQNTIYFYNQIFTYTSWGLIFLILGIQFYYSIKMGRYILNPVIHLTEILKQIRVQNSKQKENGKDNQIDKTQIANSLYVSQSIFSEVSTEQDNQILIDEQIDADFDGVCHSRDTQDLLNSFQNLFKMLRFTTQNFYKEDASTQLLNLIKQIQHFEQFGNYRALGVCYNNMGVIHYNCGRYQEALENFQKAITYANYELNIYSHQGEGAQFSNSIKRFTVHLRSSLQNNVSSKDLTDSTNNLKISNIQEKSKSKTNNNQYNQNQQVELYWSLYNRKTNLFKAMLMFIQISKSYLWDILEDQALENLSISQIYLPPSYKREIINYYALSKGVINQNFSNEAIVLNKLSWIYIKIYETKYRKLFDNCPNYFKMQDFDTPQKKEQNTFQDYLINTNKILINTNSNNQNNNNNNNNNNQFNDINSSIILLSPIQRIKCYQQNESIQNKVKNKIQNLINMQYMNQIKNQQLYVQPIHQNSPNRQERRFDQKKNQQKQQISIFQQQSCYKPVDDDLQSHRIIQESDNKLIVNEQNIFSPNISGVDNRQSLSPLIIFQKDDKIAKQNRKQSQFKQQLTHSQNLEIIQNINQKPRKSILLNSSMQNINLDTQKASSQKQNKHAKFFAKRKETQKDQQNSKFVFYQVRKHKNNEQVRNYEYSSDIYFQYCTLEQAQYQVKQQNYYSAALMLTNSLEQCQQYLPHLKKLEMDLLLEIFKQQKIKSIDLEVKSKKYNQMTYFDFNISVISSIQKQSNQLKLFALCNDLINEILFKENDYFGMIVYNFQEQIFMQQIATTQIKLIQSNPQLFEQIFLSLLLNKHQHNLHKVVNNKTQNQLKSTQDHSNQFHNLPSTSQDKHFSQDMNFNFHSLANLTHHLKLDSFSKLESPQLSKTVKNSKNHKEIKGKEGENINIQLASRKLNSLKNYFLEQIQIIQNSLESSQDSQIERIRLDSDQCRQDKNKFTQINKTSIQDLENYKTICHLNSINSQQIPEQVNTKLSLALNDKDKINNIIFDEHIDDSTNILSFSSKQCLDTKKSQSNNDIVNSQMLLNGSKNNELQNYQGNKIQKKSYFDEFQKKRAQIQENKIIKKCSQNKNQPDTKTHRQLQYEINQILENEEETSNNDKVGTSSKSETSKFQSKSNSQSQKEIPIQNLQNNLSDQSKQNNLLPFPNNNQNQSQQISENPFQFKLKEFHSDTNLNKCSHHHTFDQNTHQNNLIFFNSNGNMLPDEKRNNEEEIQDQNKKIFTESSEYLFHLGIHASLKQFILNSDKKLNIYLTQNKYKIQNNKKYNSSSKTLQNYLIYVTDQYFKITNTNMMEKLTHLLNSLDTELLVLILNDSQQLDEMSSFENISIDGVQIIGFFNTEEKLLQYIYNNREHLKNYLMPMILEHF
ncbi:hypothetical protein ABPG74_020475 [Tetrahymena malaccensis]